MDLCPGSEGGNNKINQSLRGIGGLGTSWMGLERDDLGRDVPRVGLAAREAGEIREMEERREEVVETTTRPEEEG